MSYSQQAESSAIRFPINHRSFLWDGSLACTHKSCRFCIPMITCGKFVTGQHTISFHQSRTLANAVPLGFCWVAFPPPPVTTRQRSSTFVEPLRPLRRVLFQRVPLVFIRVARESLATFS